MVLIFGTDFGILDVRRYYIYREVAISFGQKIIDSLRLRMYRFAIDESSMPIWRLILG
jgi:hypothetical protein